jgi:transcriptional regulator with XRE-family HTH domain
MARTKRVETEKAGPGIPFEKVLAEELKDPEFRLHYEQRLLVHEVALTVRTLRERAGLTQAELAKKIGSTQPSIARIEKSVGYSTPQWETLFKIASATGKQLKLSFFDRDETEPRVELDGLPVEPPPRPQRRRSAPPSTDTRRLPAP